MKLLLRHGLRRFFPRGFMMLAGLALLPQVSPGAEIAVADAAAFRRAVSAIAPGDVLVLKDGEWRDVDLVLAATGTAEQPVTLRAEHPGKVVLTGKSRLRLGGAHLLVEGLWFRNASPENGDIIAFRVDSKTTARRSRITQCAVTQDQESTGSRECKWVSLYGEGNQVDHCHFEGKTSRGTLLVVWLEGSPAGHVVEHNYFGARPRLGKNGGEIIRVGDSESSMQPAGCRVSRNLFEHCDGEVEIISNKSCENVYAENVFVQCQGALTLRHGNRCRVEGNAFLGHGKKHTGGIRVTGEDHTVVNNYLEGLQGEEARAAICLMSGIPDSPLNGYFQVRRAVVQGNWVKDCAQSLNIGYGDKDVSAVLPPVQCRILENRVMAPVPGPVVTLVNPAAEILWQGNFFSGGGAPGIPPVAGVVWRKDAGVEEGGEFQAARARAIQWLGGAQGRSQAGAAWRLRGEVR